MNKTVYIVGAGGHGKVILDILLESGVKPAGFLDDDVKKHGSEINGLKVHGSLKDMLHEKNIAIALGIGSNQIRRKIYELAKKNHIIIVQTIHPKAIISRSATIGEGVAVMAGVVINASAVLEEGVVANTGSTIDHDCHLAKFCQIYPGAHLAGTVFVGEESYVGTGAAVIQNIKIGNKTMVGAGAVVVSDIKDNVTVVGVPAKQKNI